MRDFEADYRFFYQNKDKFNYSSRSIRTIREKPSAPSAKSGFITYLKTGKIPTESSEPSELRALILSRLTILGFIESEAKKARPGSPVALFLNNFIDPPNWILTSYIKKAVATSPYFRD